MEAERDCVAGGIRLVIAVGVRLYREGLAQSLAREAGISVVGTAVDDGSAVASVRTLKPDITLLDSGMHDSLTTLRTLLAVAPACRVVVLALTESEEIISYATAGMSGYVSRNDSFEHLVAAIRGVAGGEFPCSPRAAALLLQHVAKVSLGAPPNGRQLTGREQQIADLIDQGLSNKEIARRLSIEVSTVKNHIHHILQKLHVARRGQAAARFRPRSPDTRPAVPAPASRPDAV